MKRTFTAMESFCGPGGMALGLHRAGFRLLFAFDADAMAVETYRKNLGTPCLQAKAEDLRGMSLLNRVGLRKGDLDLFAGGPPCQGFSKQKRGAHNGDLRNGLVLEHIRLIQELLPRFFILENVAIFGQKRGRQYVEQMLISLKGRYDCFPHFYNCADYGLAQTRERYIVVGKRSDICADFRIPRPTVTRWRTVGEELRGLPEPPKDYSVHLDYPNHQDARVTAINIKRITFVTQGGGWKDIPKRYRLRCHNEVDTSRGGWPDVYGRLEWDGQAPTITGGFDSFTRGRYAHPLKNRPLTPREAAKIQGFPLDFAFCGTRADWRSQIGNAVPPPLAEAVGKEIILSLREDAIAPKVIKATRQQKVAVTAA